MSDPTKFTCLIKWLMTVACLVFSSALSSDNSNIGSAEWSSKELALINSLRLQNLGESPVDPSNRFSGITAAENLGRQIFNDSRFSKNGQVSCSSCHQSEYGFTDSLPRAKGIELTSRRSMPLAGVAYQQWFFWDGRSDSLWSQALSPLENPREHGLSRSRVAELVLTHYRAAYDSIVQTVTNNKLDELTLPLSETKTTEIFVNTGKIIAAFVSTIEHESTLFDEYANATLTNKGDFTKLFSPKEKNGLRLFIGKAQCISCHNGPLFSNGEFHHAGVEDDETLDHGRAAAVELIAQSEFSCYSVWSDASKEKECEHLRFLDTNAQRYYRAFKTPSLRGVAARPPYMHAGQISTLAEVLKNYRAALTRGVSDELRHQDLTNKELEELEAFLATLSPL
ncbi:MAG: cytochrome-c peroxidase [Cellvibrionaceae bacterium]|nr:cytochrome-c peroxidase [Cellvibrionaceae bacterium]|tara:strand:- start:664 stop:1851 length:1188 start_codon:yes stop_codon:yes gene_type:complete